MIGANQQLIGAIAEGWYGYGRWDASFWFLGPQPGGSGPDAPARAWASLGSGELLDCKTHHFAFDFKKWHTPDYPLQPTWRRLMLLLMSFAGRDFSKEALKAYQAEPWGAESGETCVIELCAVASSKFKQIDGDMCRTRRIGHIRKRMDQHNPVFVVMYGNRQRESWEVLAGGAFDQYGLRRVGDTLAFFRPHPGAHGYTDEYWIDSGLTLRNRCVTERLWPRR